MNCCGNETCGDADRLELVLDICFMDLLGGACEMTALLAVTLALVSVAESCLKTLLGKFCGVLGGV